MFSIEVFYYALYINVFKPARIRPLYFYPFGSTDAKDLQLGYGQSEFEENPKCKHHVIFYDQEPILDHSKKLFDGGFLQSSQAIKLLANSEVSPLKKQICKDHGYLDWYYFYHGFAALDWYRDFRYLENAKFNFKNAFLSLNRLVTADRSYRLALVSEYMERNLLSKGSVSLHLNDMGYKTWKEEINDPNTQIPELFKEQIIKHISPLTQSLIVDRHNVPGYASADTGSEATKLNQQSLFHVVSETIFYYDKLHLTEKIFKPIVSKRPFILVAAPGNLAYFKSYGFKTFDRWIDESYDKEQDPVLRIRKIVDQIEKISKLSLSDLNNLYEDMQETVNYNFNHFFGNFRKIITDELFENLDRCFRIWNNGRVDERGIDIENINLEQVKKLFMQ